MKARAALQFMMWLSCATWKAHLLKRMQQHATNATKVGSQDNSNLSLQGYRKICVHVGTHWNTLPRWTPLGHAGPLRGPVRWLIALIAVAWQLWFAEATAASTPQMPWAKHWICAGMAAAMAIVETNWCNTRRWKQPVWDLHAQWAEPHGNRLVRTSR